MRTIISALFQESSRLAPLVLPLALIAVVGIGCNLGKGQAGADNRTNTLAMTDPDKDRDMPDEVLLKALVKETTADFSYAISTGDFAKMYEKASTDFKSQYTPDQMKDVFKTAVDNKRQLLPVLAKIVSLDPTYSPEPQIRREQGVPVLVVNGKYDLKPKPLSFSYEYVKREGRFKLLKLVLS